MVKAHNTGLTQEQLRIVKPKGEYLSSEVAPILQLVRDVSPIIDSFVRDGTAANTTTALMTTPNETDKDFFLTHAMLNLNQRVAGVGITPNAQLEVTINGVVRNVLRLELPTNLVSTESVSLSFSTPIKIDRNTAINLISAGDANTLALGSVGGYME